jgi:hypothetical protein
MSQATRFRELLDCIGRTLAPSGLKKSGPQLYIRRDGNWVGISFQKSIRTSRDTIVFTINAGITSGRLLAFAGIQPAGVPNDRERHWSMRLGSMLSPASDRWWVLDDATRIEDLCAELAALIRDVALPQCEALIADEALRDLWLAGTSPGLTEIDRLKNLSILLKSLGPSDRLDETLKRLQTLSAGKPTEPMVRYHLNRLAATNPQ